MLQNTPTYPQSKLTSNLDDYEKKASMKRVCNKKAGSDDPASSPHQIQ
jgi:hypothetical protein